MKRYRVALVGTGAVSAEHLQALREAGERVDLQAVVGVNPASVEAFRAAHGIPRAYTDVDQMLSEVQPDLVHILTPPATHADLCIRCLDAGAWVFCEKPLCASLAEFDRISAAEQRNGRYVNTVFQWRFGSAARHVKRLIEAGALGYFLLATCNTLWYRDAGYYSVEWRSHWRTAIGGTAISHGIHHMDLLLWLIPDWHEVQATIATLDRDIEVDNVALAMVRFQGGAMASIVSSAVSPRQETRLRLDFQDATVEVSGLYSYTNQNWRYSPRQGLPDDGSKHWPPDMPDEAATQAAQLRRLLDSMDRGERPDVSGDESRRVLEFITCLYKSALTRQPVQRGSITPDDPFYASMTGHPDEVSQA